MKKLLEKLSRLYVLCYIIITCVSYNMNSNPSILDNILCFVLIFAWVVYINSDLKE